MWRISDDRIAQGSAGLLVNYEGCFDVFTTSFSPFFAYVLPFNLDIIFKK
jgi:hypothetical protein